MDIDEINQSTSDFLFRMLGRLKADCLYYLENGGRFAGHLWAHNEREQIKLMRMIYRHLCEVFTAPEWMSEEKINAYAEQMLVVYNFFWTVSKPPSLSVIIVGGIKAAY